MKYPGLIVHGARVSCRVVDAHHRRSPLIQGGMEIPVEVTVEMDISEENALAMENSNQRALSRANRWKVS